MLRKIINFVMPDDLAKEIIRTLLPVTGLITLGFIFLIVYALQFCCSPNLKSFLSVLGTGCLSSCAFLLFGGLLGFLFGIPKIDNNARVHNGDNDDRNSKTRNYTPNTNLEQISDWLTKILVGVSLTQFPLIRDEFIDLMNYLKPSFGITESNNGGIILVLIVHFLISGFIAGFLWSRLDLIRKFKGADRESLEIVREFRKEYEYDTNAKILAHHQLNKKFEAPNFHELSNAIKKASPTAKSEIFFQATIFRSENWREHKDRMERTIPVFSALEASDTNKDYHRNLAELGFAYKDSQKPKYREAEKALSEAIKRRDRNIENGKEEWLPYLGYYEFNRAICRIRIKSNQTDEIKKDLKKAREQGILDNIERLSNSQYLEKEIIEEIEQWEKELQANSQ